jgi:hypothetical protein
VARALVSIEGLTDEGGEIHAVVRFSDSARAEAVPLARMHDLYMKELLNFYEGYVVLG